MKTSLNETLDAVDTMEKYDAACKLILSQKVILAWILKDYVDEYKESSVQEIMAQCIESEPEVDAEYVMPVIRGIRTEDSDLEEGTIRGDIRFMANTPRGIRQIFDVEAQGRFRLTYPLSKRGTYYLGRMISSQKGTEFKQTNYQDLKKVFVIWICLKPPRAWRNVVAIYKMQENNQIGELRLDPSEYDLMTQIVIGLGDPADADATGTLRMLDVLFSDRISIEEKKRILEQEFDIPMTEELKEGVEKMCTFSEAILDEGIERGMKQGIERGINQGMGRVNELYRFLISSRREDDMRKAIDDEVYLEILLNEFEGTLA